MLKKSDGSVRKAMVFLEQVLQVSEEQQEALVNKITEEENIDAIELCRALTKNQSWSIISGILKNVVIFQYYVIE